MLLHWSAAAADTRLYYAGATPLGMDETSIRFLERDTPTAPVTVLNQAGGGALEAELMAERKGLLFLTLDEAANGMDLDGDGDSSDENVLALLDGTDPLARTRSVALALASKSSPVDARLSGAGDWLVAFLVDEAGQGGVSLNDPSRFGQPLLPPQCGTNPPDTDAADEVLHFLEFADFLAGAVPVSTGLAGRGRVLALAGVVATTSAEADAGCDLNDDGDSGDEVARWVAAVTPVAPASDLAQMHALETSVAGGSMGLSHLDERLIAVVSEAADSQDLDTKVEEHDLVAWLDPGLGTLATWHFAHQHPTLNNFGTGVFDTDGDSEPFAGTDWMAAEPTGDRLGITFLEEVPGTNPNMGSINSNLDCSLVLKDADKTDALPVWADFETGPTLDWDGVGYAVDGGRAGITIAAGFAFFRVSENDDNRDYNGDGDQDDVVLFRNPLTACAPVAMATSSGLSTLTITTDGVQGAAFLTDESAMNTDVNGDGDTADAFVRYFLF